MARRRKIFGKWGEDMACKFLARNGFEVIDRNFYTTFGEIDIVARKNGDYYFVEVKTRRKGGLANNTAITPIKVSRLNKAVSKYCLKHSLGDVSIILAGIMVVVDKLDKTVNFNFSVIF